MSERRQPQPLPRPLLTEPQGAPRLSPRPQGRTTSDTARSQAPARVKKLSPTCGSCGTTPISQPSSSLSSSSSPPATTRPAHIPAAMAPLSRAHAPGHVARAAFPRTRRRGRCCARGCNRRSRAGCVELRGWWRLGWHVRPSAPLPG